MEAIEHNRIHNSVGSHCNCADIEIDRLRVLLADVRDWLDNPGGEPTSSDLLDRINEALP